MEMVVLPGDPASKARPRVVNRGRSVYSPSKSAQDAIALCLKTSIREKYLNNVAVGCIFFRSNRQRIDADNMLKLVLDAATGVVWEDDCQVTAVTAIVELDTDNPRTVVVFAEHKSSMRRGKCALPVCEICGKRFKGTHPAAKFCSRSCQGEARAKLREKPCSYCGKVFRPENSYRKMCSPECRSASLRDKRKANARAVGHCLDCGKQTSKPAYKRCRDCWRVARRHDVSA
jgi:Holliday junction resolvase RusA-like endonuclease